LEIEKLQEKFHTFSIFLTISGKSILKKRNMWFLDRILKYCKLITFLYWFSFLMKILLFSKFSIKMMISLYIIKWKELENCWILELHVFFKIKFMFSSMRKTFLSKIRNSFYIFSISKILNVKIYSLLRLYRKCLLIIIKELK
jgi:hypothetical protein